MKEYFALVMAAITVGSAGTAAEPNQRQVVLEAMQRRPDDPWPRGTGHVLLAAPGSREVNKGYYEPGGSFSPTFGSFGASLWVVDDQQHLKVTSDAIPLDQIRQRFAWPNLRGVPNIHADTLYYQSVWALAGPGAWLLQVHPKTNTGTHTWVVIRSVGPAGAPIRSLEWDGGRLLVNRRWTLTCDPPPASVRLAHEGSPQWTTWPFTNTVWNSTDGWCCARIELARGRDARLTVRDAVVPPVPPLAFPSAYSTLQMTLPDEQFIGCLNAQVAHLLMGTVGLETRPGDPNHYPLSWARHAAYIISALARAGQVAVARELLGSIVERDFPGGFGPEADAPGTELWAMEEVAARGRQTALDAALWPHALRKVQLIADMLAANRPVYRPLYGPVVPQYAQDKDLRLLCEAARDGLVVGKMDWTRPVLFVNAANYGGLQSAARLADRYGDSGSSAAWLTLAAQLRQAWQNELKPPHSENERTYVNGLWPTWIAGANNSAYESGLEGLWATALNDQGSFKTPPIWTYYSVAEAHQWLYLMQPDRVWQVLRWFWQNQSAPGLFTWGEGKDEENTFHLWERVRGWTKPPNVTPHYWTAAEVLLLQLDMLAYLDESGPSPALVIGGGIPAAWLNRPMSVRGLSTRLGQVDWNWQNRRMTVVMRGNRCPVRLGPAFPANTPVVLP